MKIVIFDQDGIKEFIPANSKDFISDEGFITLLKKEFQKTEHKENTSKEFDLLTIADIVLLFKTTRPTIYAWIEKKLLSPIKLGGRVYFDPNDIKKIIEQKKTSSF